MRMKYAGIEYRWRKVVGDACLMLYVLTKITMIKTKNEIENENKIRLDLEELTKEIVWLESKIEEKQKEINRLPAHKLKFLRDLVNERSVLEGRKEYLEWKRNEKINLLNQIS